MAQLFNADSQVLQGNVTTVTTAETTGPVTNPVRVPFQNGKVAVRYTARITIATGATSLSCRIRRNPSAENVALGPGVVGLSTVGGAGTLLSISGELVDLVPDGRDCVYALTVQQNAATANGSILQESSISAQVMSG